MEELAPAFRISRPAFAMADAPEDQADATDQPRSPSTSHHERVPIFPDTPDGRAARERRDNYPPR